MACREIIFRDENLTVVFSDFGTDTVFATFNEMGMHANGDAFWGSRLFDGMQLSTLGFVSARPNWYPLASMIEAIERSRSRIAGRRVVTYGFSQGGYGALKFSRQLSASLTLAFSPQWSINPAELGGKDLRFISYYDAKLRNGEQIRQHDLGGMNFVFYDSRMPEDAFNARHIGALKDVALIPMPFSGHNTIYIVSEGGISRALIKSCLDRAGFSNSDLRSIIRQGRRQSSTYAEAKVAQLEPSCSRHSRFVKNALACLPAGPTRSLAEIRVALSAGDTVRAEAALLMTTDADLVKVDFLNVWSKFRATRFTTGEARLAPLFKLRYPTNVFARLHGVNSYVQLGEAGLAETEMGQLLTLPGASAHSTHFIDFFQRLGLADRAGQVAKLFAESEVHDRATRLRVGFELLSIYKRHDMRAAMFNEILRQAQLCRGESDRLMQLINMALGIGSFSAVEHIIVDNPQLRVSEPIVDIYAAECEAVRDKRRGSLMMMDLFSGKTVAYGYWFALSAASERLLGVEYALRAAKRALALADDENMPKARYRLAQLFTYTGASWRAAYQLKKLLRVKPAPTRIYGSLAHIALKSSSPKLAPIFAKSCIAEHGDDVALVLLSCRALVGAAQQSDAAPHLCLLLDRAEAGARLSKTQFQELIKCCQATGFALEQRALAAAIRAFPSDPDFAQLTSKGRALFAGKFFDQAITSHADA